MIDDTEVRMIVRDDNPIVRIQFWQGINRRELGIHQSTLEKSGRLKAIVDSLK